VNLTQRVDLDALPFAVGAIGLGVVSIVVRDFALQWQPVPAAVPAHGFLASLSGVILIAGGIATLSPNAGRARLILPLFYALWVVALHIPRVVAHPGVATLLGLAEILSLALAGTLLIAARFEGLVLRLYGLSPIVFGLSHFVFIAITAGMVPAWIPPGGVFWGYLTGTAHIAAGLAITSGIERRLAATLLAAMCGVFTLLVTAPGIMAAPDSQAAWTPFFVSLSIAGGAWLVRSAAADGVRARQFLSGINRRPGTQS
jgi:uncharacterized membrane protein YphA (DoxX/SURF4 family)